MTTIAAGYQLIGVPKSRNDHQLRFGEGSLVVTVKGSKQGMWFDFAKGFESKAGGDMLTLVQLQKECSFREAVNFGVSYVSQHQKTADSSLEFGSSIQNREKVMLIDTRLTLTGEAGAKELVKKTELPPDVSNNKQEEVAAKKIIQKDVEMEL